MTPTPEMIEAHAKEVFPDDWEVIFGNSEEVCHCKCCKDESQVNLDKAQAALTASLAVMWQPLPPERQFVRTKREGEDGENVCALWSEWTDKAGRTTVTHHSFATPTHWMPLPDPPKETA